jgi:hypothetical protein
MGCSKYGFENRETVKFCEERGTASEAVCRNCGAKVPLERKFRGECGNALAVPQEPLPPDHTQPRSYTPKQHLIDKILTTRSTLERERTF